MKRFFPSSIMLIPFVVKHYDNDEVLNQIDEQTQVPNNQCEPLEKTEYEDVLDLQV